MTDPQLIDQLCQEFDAEWRAGTQPSLRACLRKVDPASQTPLFRRLFAIDVDHRRRLNLNPIAEDYRPLGEAAVRYASRELQSQQNAGSPMPSTPAAPTDTPVAPDTAAEQPVAEALATLVSPSSPDVQPDRDLKTMVGEASPDDADDHSDDDSRIIDAYQQAHQPGDKSPMIGPYKLLQRIGQGGMGSVFMAEQEKPVRRRVALKLIKAGMGSKEVISRFEAERQALAMMDHPNIARVLDAGTTVDRRPYFVMELGSVPKLRYR